VRNIILILPVPVDSSADGPERELDWHKVGGKLHRRNEQVGATGRAKCRVVGLFRLGLGSLCGDLPDP
jgi:hypothetical protein